MARPTPLIIYCIILLLLALLRPLALPVTSPGSLFKLHHIAAFLVLTLLTLWTLKHRPQGQRLLLGVLLPFAFGIFIEAVQQRLPYRSGQWQDLISNSVGILVGLLIHRLGSRFLRRRNLGTE